MSKFVWNENAWDHAAPAPISLVLLTWDGGGTTLACRDLDGTLYGMRDVMQSPEHDEIVAEFVALAYEKGLEIEDLRSDPASVSDRA